MFYTCKNDRAFKEVFMKEDNKDILKALLESILKVEIEEIDYLNLEKNTSNINIKRKHFDLHLKTNIGNIQVEVNGGIKPYTRSRNTAYICDTYSHEVFVGEEYFDEKLVIQINFTYGLGEKEKDLRIYKLRDEELKEYVSNLLIYEFNMDYYMKVWYSKDKEKIEEYKYIIMQNLELADLEKLSKDDRMVKKYMEEIERVNEDPEIRVYLTEEQDREFRENTMKNAGIKEGSYKKSLEIAKNMKNLHIDINTICKATSLTKEEIENL